MKTTKEWYYIKDGIVPDVTDRIIISNPSENPLYGDKEELMSTGDSTDSEHANPMDKQVNQSRCRPGVALRVPGS